MQCQSVDLDNGGGYVRCQKEATHRLWCPTWITAHTGPMDLCDEHAGTFKPEVNPYNGGSGSFHWGEEADAAFRSVEEFFQPDDPRWDNVAGMLLNARQLNELLFVVDGKVWLRQRPLGLARGLILLLGDYPEAKERFPKLFGPRMEVVMRCTCASSQFKSFWAEAILWFVCQSCGKWWKRDELDRRS